MKVVVNFSELMILNQVKKKCENLKLNMMNFKKKDERLSFAGNFLNV